MKLTTFFTVFLAVFFVSLETFAQTQLENEVIASLLEKGNKLIPEYRTSKKAGRVKKFYRFKKPSFVLLNVTKSPLRESVFDTLSMFERKVLFREDRAMLKDFCTKNATTLRITPILSLAKKISFLTNVESKKIFALKDDWHAYYKKYEQKPYVSISRPGFNKNKDKAFIYLSYTLGKSDGAGYFIVMKKLWGKWRMDGPMLVWVT